MFKHLSLFTISRKHSFFGPSNQDWVQWFEDWTELLQANLPAAEAITLSLEIQKGHAGNTQLINSLEMAREKLEKGSNLADAFENIPCPAPTEILLALECSQQTGKTASICLTHLIDWKQRIAARQELIKSMVYPFIVLLASTFCWWLLDFTTASIKQEIPADTLNVWNISDYLILAGTGLLLIMLPKALKERRKERTNNTHPLSLKGWSPASAWYTSQFFFAVEQELQAGFDILHCLRHRQLKNYRPFLGQKKLHNQLNLLNARLHQQLKDGASFGEAMLNANAPEFMVRQAQISEHTGDLSSTYSMARKLFQMEARKRQNKIQSVLAPITLMLAALTLIVAYQTSVAPIYNHLSVF